MPAKAMSLRLDEERASALEAIARADDMPISEAIRTAIDAHIEQRRNDEDFQARLRRIMEEDRKILERLAK
jgi:predicted DNA-binding protein